MIVFGLEENRRLTQWYIDFAPASIALRGRTKVPDGAGGYIYKVDLTTRTPQIVTLLEPGNSGQQEPITTEDGKQYTLEFLMLGLHTADFREDDVFEYEGKEYKVVVVMPDNGYERRAAVIRHGW